MRISTRTIETMILAQAIAVTCLSGGVLQGDIRAAETEGELRNNFVSPPASDHAWTYWWWLNGAASKEGITRDLEEMKRQGIAGALLFDAGEGGPNVPRGPRFMGPEWRELYRHAVQEADRLGIALSVNICSGWDCGGPWVTHEHAAKKLVVAKASVKGPGKVTLTLPKPKAARDFYHDIAVLAAPAPDILAPGLRASSQFENFGPELAEDGSETTRWVSYGDKPGMGPTPEKPEFLQFNCDDPRPATGVYLKAYPHCSPKEVEVQCSDDGQTFRSLKRVTMDPGQDMTISFDEVQAKHFRILFLSAHPFRGAESWNVQVAEVRLMPKQESKGEGPAQQRMWDRKRAVDLGECMDETGKLTWDVPVGNWQILRIGYTLHGRKTTVVGSGPEGLEIDPMSTEAMDAHFAETGAKLIADAGPLTGKVLQYFHIDSWEIGLPTWTPRMREEFRQRRGYDPVPWLPAMHGNTVDSAAETDRFMLDYKRTVADLIAEKYYGRLQELAVKGGLLGAHSESGGPKGHKMWTDCLLNHGVNAIPMGEFWARNTQPNGRIFYGPRNHTIKQIASAAHIYNKPLCQAEAFTALCDDFTQNPWTMKDLGDSAFCDGLTRMVLCFWIHQPQPDMLPGQWYAHIGTHFSHTLTWWPMADAWLRYLARCQYMLKQGTFVADFAYLQDERIPAFVARPDLQKPRCPDGFDYDVLNTDVLVHRATARNGRLTLPGGMTYRYLVLPSDAKGIRSEITWTKIRDLAAEGVPVLGQTMRAGSLEDIVETDGLVPDIEFRNTPEKARFQWIHRRNDATEIYFISNQSTDLKNDISAEVAFRVTGKQPELWDPVTGRTRYLHRWREEDGCTRLSLRFAPRQSWFVVFREQAKPEQNAAGEKNFPELKQAQEITGPWSVQFDPDWFYPTRNLTGDAAKGEVTFPVLKDWSERSEPAIKYYSGIATYRKEFDFAANEGAGTKAASPAFHLDLGTIHDLARVRLNGRDLGTVWTAPWRVAIPRGLLKDSGNTLEIEVANLWPNRMIGDGLLPEEERHTRSNIPTYQTPLHKVTDRRGTSWAQRICPNCTSRIETGKAAELLPSGLLGPVRILKE